MCKLCHSSTRIFLFLEHMNIYMVLHTLWYTMFVCFFFIRVQALAVVLRCSDCSMPRTLQGLSWNSRKKLTTATHHLFPRFLSSPMQWSLFLHVRHTFYFFPSVVSITLSWLQISLSIIVDFTNKQIRKERPEDLDVPAALADFIHQQRTQEHVEDM